MLSAAIGFMVDLPRADVLGLLRERLAKLALWRSSVTDYYTPEGGPQSLGHIGEIMHMWVHSADAEAEWTRGLIARIEGARTPSRARAANRSWGCWRRARRTRTPNQV